MGGKSKSSSSNTSGMTSSTMGNLAKGRVSNEKVAGMQQGMADRQMGSMLPVFSEMVQNGQSMFGSNPMMKFMGGMMGMPIQMQTPDFLSGFIDKYRPQEPQQPQQPQPYNVNDDMRRRMGMGSPYGAGSPQFFNKDWRQSVGDGPAGIFRGGNFGDGPRFKGGR